MYKKGIKRIYIAIISLVLIILVVFGVLFITKDEIPIKEIQTARQKITEAKNKNAEVYASGLIRQSEILYDSAMSGWKMENGKFFALRDYSRVKKHAIQSARLADQAVNQAIEQVAGLESNLQGRINNLKSEVAAFQSVFNDLPLAQTVWRENNKGNTLLSEAEITFSGGQYILCEKKINEAERCILHSYKIAREILSDYFTGYHYWQEWGEKTIKESRYRKSFAILVDKFSRQMFIYNSGKLIHTFNIELGRNWIGDKNYQGDQATPEGLYKVTDKKNNNSTKYYKALVLNYPNEDDLRRFHAGKKNGTIHASTKIGGSIEIHGNGGKGIDWTDGCIALRNTDMDVVYRLSQPGIMVTIVGSLKPPEEINK